MFTVVLPVYNHAAFVAEAVLSALRSPLVSEVLVVDDGSSDGSPDILRALARGNPKRVRDLTDPASGNLNAPARLNQLVGEASNEWIAVLNSDDVFMPGRFELIAQHIRRNGHDFVYGHLCIIDAEGRPIGTKRGILQPEFPLPASTGPASAVAKEPMGDVLANQNFIATTSNMVFTRDLHRRIGGFKPLHYCHDWAFALAAGALGRPLYLPHFLTGYRVHGHNTISQNVERIAEEVRSMFAEFARDYPAWTQRAGFQRWLAGNRYLREAPPSTGKAA